MSDRNTKYTSAVHAYVSKQGHATNASILSELQKTYPNLSATTIHRITTRMVERGELTLAPTSHRNNTRFDAVLQPHDHFSCSQCDCLRDITLPQEVRKLIQGQLDGCSLSGSLTISGICVNCKENHEKNYRL